MTPPRAAAWVLLALSIAGATAIADPPAAALPTVGGYRLATADLHVHAFLGDGGLAPWDIAREARRRGLDVVAISNHNQMYAARLHRALFTPPAHPLVIPSVEVTTPRFHLAALGITGPIDWRLPLADAVRTIHAQGGIAIAAHPTGGLWERLAPETLALLDGVEVAHPIGLEAESRAELDALYSRIRQIKPTIAPIGSSDFHFAAPVGAWRTRLLVRDLTIAAVFEAIRAGRTVAFDRDGRAFGDPEWVAAATAVPLNDVKRADTWWHHAAMFGAWLALAFLVIFGSTRAA